METAAESSDLIRALQKTDKQGGDEELVQIHRQTNNLDLLLLCKSGFRNLAESFCNFLKVQAAKTGNRENEEENQAKTIPDLPNGLKITCFGLKCCFYWAHFQQ